MLLIGESLNVISRKIGRAVYRFEKSFMDKTSDFIRWDAGASLQLNRPNGSFRITIDLQNVSNRKNIYSQYYDTESQSISYLYSLPFIPVFNIEYNF